MSLPTSTPIWGHLPRCSSRLMPYPTKNVPRTFRWRVGSRCGSPRGTAPSRFQPSRSGAVQPESVTPLLSVKRCRTSVWCRCASATSRAAVLSSEMVRPRPQPPTTARAIMPIFPSLRLPAIRVRRIFPRTCRAKWRPSSHNKTRTATTLRSMPPTCSCVPCGAVRCWTIRYIWEKTTRRTSTCAATPRIRSTSPFWAITKSIRAFTAIRSRCGTIWRRTPAAVTAP